MVKGPMPHSFKKAPGKAKAFAKGKFPSKIKMGASKKASGKRRK